VTVTTLFRRSSAPGAGVAAAVGLAYLAVLAFSMQRQTYDGWGGVILAPVCLAIGATIVMHVTRNEAETIRNVALLGLGAKLMGAFARYYVMKSAFDSAGDFERYHRAGVAIAAAHDGWLAPANAWPTGRGTVFVEQFTGVVYTIIGPSRMGGFVMFSFIAYWGLFFFQRALATAAPAFDQVRYAKLVFLWPSLLFWPSSIGKEALMLFALGLATLGAARVHVQRIISGTVLFGLGGWVAYAIRPHLTVLLVGALIVSYLVSAERAQERSSGGLGPLPRVVALAVMLVGFTFLMGQTADYFGGDGGDGGDTIAQILAATEQRTAVGGSVFASSRPNSALEYPNAVVTVLFRPFIFEARSVPVLISAVEATMLAGLTIVSLRRTGRALKARQRTRLVVFTLVFNAAFVFGFSSFSNLGLLARQRTQVLPFLFVLFAGPAAVRATRRADTVERAERQAPVPPPGTPTVRVIRPGIRR